MIERQIASVVWHPHGHRIEVIYVAGEPDRLHGSYEVTATMSADQGLERVPTSDGTVRWIRPRSAGAWSS
jgi:hypothetical protein